MGGSRCFVADAWLICWSSNVITCSRAFESPFSFFIHHRWFRLRLAPAND
jgi:hypothetical protein